jgi:hypothetical protein
MPNVAREHRRRWFYDYRTEESSLGRSFPLLTHIRWASRHRDQSERCLQLASAASQIGRAAIRGAIRVPGRRHERHDFGVIVAQYANYTIGMNVRFWPCVTSIVGPYGDTQLYER